MASNMGRTGEPWIRRSFLLLPLLVLLVVPVQLAGASRPEHASSTRSKTLARVYRERTAIRRQAGIIIRFLERRRSGVVLTLRERQAEMEQLAAAARYLEQYQPGLSSATIDLKKLQAAIDRNQANKKEAQKGIEELMARLQQGIEAIMQMLDQAVRTNEALEDDD